MANQFLNTSWVSMEVLRLLVNKKMVAEAFNTDYEKDFSKSFAVGSQITVKFPQRFLIRDGLGYTPQAINRISTTVNLDQIFGVDFEWDSYERAVKMERSREELKKEYLDPASDQMAQELDSRAALHAYQNASNVFGTLGTDPTTIAPMLAMERRLFEKACPAGDRYLCISASAMAAYVGPNVTQFNPAPEISKMYKSGVIGMAAGWEWFRSNSLYSHTAGSWAGAVTVNGAGQTGTTLLINATVNDTFKKGDKFSISSVNAVNPVTRRVAGVASANHFTITQDYTALGTAADSLQILPAIYGPGSQYQNVSALPGNAAALTLWPGTITPNGLTGTVSLGLSKYAFAMVGAKLEMPTAVEVATQHQDPQTGIPIAFIRQFDGVQRRMINRFDTLLGFGNLYQDNGAVCLAGA